MRPSQTLLRLIENYGFRLVPVGSDGFSYDAVEFRGEKLARPVRVVLHSDETVSAYVDRFHSRSIEAGCDAFELAMMNILEGLETTDLEGKPASRMIGIRKEPNGDVVWLQEDYPAPPPPPGAGDLEWRADPLEGRADRTGPRPSEP